MSEAVLPARWSAVLEGVAHRAVQTTDGVCVQVELPQLRETLQLLRDRAGFEMCTFVTAIDHYPKQPRFQLQHQLLSIAHNERVRVRCLLPDESAPSCADLWPGADWMERECYDLFGIRFEGHPNLRRLLMPEGYEHHPLRKEFPHKGIEPDKLYREWDRKRRAGWTEPA